ncbi:hypothetical protein Btru_054922 [Bulinus truncatus]|nr:hypothetical protein Btru_054922 [Bulinus truncatus]
MITNSLTPQNEGPVSQRYVTYKDVPTEGVLNQNEMAVLSPSESQIMSILSDDTFPLGLKNDRNRRFAISDEKIQSDHRRAPGSGVDRGKRRIGSPETGTSERITSQDKENWTVRQGCGVSSGVAINVSKRGAINVSSRVAINVSSRVASNMSSRVAINVSSRVAINVSSRVAINVSSRVAINVPSRVAINVPSRLAINVSSSVAINVSSVYDEHLSEFLGSIGERKRSLLTPTKRLSVRTVIEEGNDVIPGDEPPSKAKEKDRVRSKKNAKRPSFNIKRLESEAQDVVIDWLAFGGVTSGLQQWVGLSIQEGRSLAKEGGGGLTKFGPETFPYVAYAHLYRDGQPM